VANAVAVLNLSSFSIGREKVDAVNNLFTIIFHGYKYFQVFSQDNVVSNLVSKVFSKLGSVAKITGSLLLSL
jgi:hypothetical protein